MLTNKNKTTQANTKKAASSLATLMMQVYVGVAVLLISVAALGYFLLKDVSEQKAKYHSSKAHEELSYKIQQKLDHYVIPLETLAADPLIQQALSSPEGRAEREQELASAIGAVNVQLVAAGKERSYLGKYPSLSYTELDLIHEAQRGHPPGVDYHDLKGEQSHVDVVRAIVRDDRLLGKITVGYILARYDGSAFQKDVARLFKAYRAKGRLELSQVLSDGSTQVFMAMGDTGLKELSEADSSALASTRWKLSYWQLPFERHILGMSWHLLYWLVIVGVLLAVAGALVIFWKVVERKAQASFNTFYEFVRDRLNGHWLGQDYRLTLAEFQVILDQTQRLDWSASQTPGREDETDVSAEVSALSGSDTSVADKEFERSYVDLLYSSEGVEVGETGAVPEVKLEITPRESNPDVSESLFRAYDIRGVVGDTLTVDVAYDIGRAFGSEALQRGEQTIVVGRDGRSSSPELSGALIQGLCDTGRDVIDLGQVSTPLVYFATHYLSTRSGVMVTGSHNPPSYNGVKMVLQGDALSEDAIKKLYQRIISGDYATGERGSVSKQDLLADYTARIAGDVELLRPLKVVIDCGNGVAAAVATPLLRSLGCEVAEELFCDVDGRFPNHHPDPSQPENLSHLIAAIQQHDADIGIAFDGDGDRLGVVDSHGNIIWPDRLMMYFAQDLLVTNPGGLMIYDVKSSRHLQMVIEESGGKGMMWKTGHSLLKAKVKETGALLGGELSGHFCFNDRWFGFDDAFYAMARLLELLSKNHSSTHDVFDQLPQALVTPELKINLEEGEQHRFMAELKKKPQFPGAKLTTIDGIRADFPDGWGLIRASNTTPSLTLRFEADNEESMARIQAVFRSVVLRVSPEIQLPF